MREMFISAWDVLLRFSGAAGGAMSGGSLPLMIALMGLNLILSMFMAENGRKQKWNALLRSVIRKLTVLGVILVAGWLDGISGKGNTLRNAAVGFYSCDEGLALLKNAAMLGVPIPSILQKAVKSLQTAENQNENHWLSEGKKT